MKFDEYTKALAEEISILTHDLKRTQGNASFMPSPEYNEKSIEREAKLDALITYIMLNTD